MEKNNILLIIVLSSFSILFPHYRDLPGVGASNKHIALLIAIPIYGSGALYLKTNGDFQILLNQYLR